MNQLQADILSVLSYEKWHNTREIEAKLKVERDRRTSVFGIRPALHNLEREDWIEKEMREEDMDIRIGNRRAYFRKKKNGKRVDSPGFVQGKAAIA